MDLWIHDNVPWELEIQALRRGLLNLGGQWSEPTLSCKPYAVLGTCTLPDLAYGLCWEPTLPAYRALC